jgi:hypothetical protein
MGIFENFHKSKKVKINPRIKCPDLKRANEIIPNKIHER